MSLLIDITQFMLNRKKLWLAPMVVAMLLLGAVVALSETMLAPFIYTLF